MSKKRGFTQEVSDSFSELCNIAFGAAANNLNVKYKKTVKLMHPKVGEVDTERLAALLKDKSLVVKYQSGAFHRGGMVCVLDISSLEKLTKHVLNRSVEFQNEDDRDDLLKCAQDMYVDIKEAADSTLEFTLGREVAFDKGSFDFIEFSQLELSHEYSEGLIEVQLKFIVEDILETVMFCFFPVAFALDLNNNFVSAVNIQVSEFIPTGFDHDAEDVARLKNIIRYCQRLGNFSLIANLVAGINVRLSSKKMLMRDVWALNPGSLIEFKNEVNDPVEVIFGGKCIAIADVITMGENFGIKIKEVRR